VRQKVVASFLVGFLLSLGMLGSSVPASAEAPMEKVKVDSHALNVVSKNICKMNDLIYRGKDGLYHIDRKAKDIVGKEAVELFSKGLKPVNEAIKTGEIIVNKENTISVPKKDLLRAKNRDSIINRNTTLIPKKGISIRIGWDVYWWGYRVYYNGDEAQKLQYALEKAGNVAGLAAVLTNWIPHKLLSKASGLTGAIVTYGIQEYARDIARARTKAGITIDVYWYLSVWTLPEVRGR
jgi:hypothetical protein